jgi:hypothetical protein
MSAQLDSLTGKQLAAIESLARDVEAPLNEVVELYRIEHAKLESTAKIKTYVPVFANRRVRTLFEMRHSLVGERVGSA